MIVDSLAYLEDGLIEALDAAGIERAIVGAPRARGTGYEPGNDRVAAAVAASSGRLIGFARVDPLTPGARAEVERARGLGLSGLFLHPWEDCFRVTDPAVGPLVGGQPLIVATGYPWVSEGLQVGELARRHPETTVIATNGAQINISGLGQQDAELALEACANLCIQTTGVYREDFLEKVVARFGAERLLFAGGFPRFDPRLELLRVRWAPGFDETARSAILGGNAMRILSGAESASGSARG